MAYLFGLILFLSGMASAETIPATNATMWKCTGGNGTIYTSGFMTESAACQAWGPLEGSYHSALESGWGQYGNCLLRRNSDNALMGGCYTGNHYGYICPLGEGWTLSGTSCSRPDCPIGQTYHAGVCTADCASKNGQTFSGFIPTGSSPTFVNQGGCAAVIIQATDQCKIAGQPAICGTWSYTGEQAQGGEPALSANTDPVTQCQTGQCAGEFNGATICLPCSGTSTGTTTQAKTVTDPLTGDKTVTITTTNYGDTVTTSTTTTTNIGGSSTTTTGTTTAEGQESYCAKNPNEPACVTGKQPDQMNPDELKKPDVDISSVLDSSGFINGTCPPDVQVALPMGHTLTLPFSSICPYLEWMGYALVAFASMSAVRIVGVL